MPQFSKFCGQYVPAMTSSSRAAWRVVTTTEEDEALSFPTN